MGMNMNFLKQAQELQEKIKKIQEDLVNKQASGSSGGDMVKATVNGKHELENITIAKEVVNPEDIEMLVSLKHVMFDGTVMCGGCRVTVGGEIKFTCVDGPEFDGHKVDFKELASRQQTYLEKGPCRLGAKIDEVKKEAE